MIGYYIRQANAVKVAEINMFSLLCACVCVYVCAHLVPLVWMGRMMYCIRLVREKLRIFPYGQYIIGNWWLKSGSRSKWGLRRNVQKCNTVSDGFSAHATARVHGAVTSLSLAGVYCARTLLGRRVCKHVDVYMITLSSPWRIYALSERLSSIYITPANWAWLAVTTSAACVAWLGAVADSWRRLCMVVFVPMSDILNIACDY